MRELMGELGLSILYLVMTAGFIALITVFIDRVATGGA